MTRTLANTVTRGARTALGCAVLLAAVPFATAASAADLPLAPEPVDYVAICEGYGFGFYRIPATDTCLRVGGRVRVDYNVYDYDEPFAQTQGPFGTYARDANAHRFRARFNVYLDSRNVTEFGLLRTFTDVQFQVDSAPTGGNPGRVGVSLSSAYIQFGGLLFGRAQSRYDFVDAFFAPGQAFLSAVSDTTSNLVAYTATFGDGFSATASLEDETARRYALLSNAAFQGGYAGERYPDLVGNVRADGEWGSVQLMGALHGVRAANVSTSALGYAIGGGASFNVPTGRGTTAGFSATFTEGALQYASSSLAGGRRIGGVFYGPADGIVDARGELRLSTGVSATAGFATGLTDTTSLSFEAGYANVDQPLTDLSGDGVADDLDFQSFAVDGSLAYGPVPGLLFAVGAQYMHVDMAEGADFGGFSTFFRAQRLF